MHLVEAVVEQCFYTANKSVSSLHRLLDYLMVYRYSLFFKLAVKSIDLVREEIKNIMASKVSPKQINAASMIYAVTHCKSVFNQSKLHCTSMLKYVDNILANQLYGDLVEYQYDPVSISSVKEEFKEKMETSSRMLQIKRVVGLLHLM